MSHIIDILRQQGISAVLSAAVSPFHELSGIVDVLDYGTRSALQDLLVDSCGFCGVLVNVLRRCRVGVLLSGVAHIREAMEEGLLPDGTIQQIRFIADELRPLVLDGRAWTPWVSRWEDAVRQAVLRLHGMRGRSWGTEEWFDFDAAFLLFTSCCAALPGLAYTVSAAQQLQEQMGVQIHDLDSTRVLFEEVDLFLRDIALSMLLGLSELPITLDENEPELAWLERSRIRLECEQISLAARCLAEAADLLSVDHFEGLLRDVAEMANSHADLEKSAELAGLEEHADLVRQARQQILSGARLLAHGTLRRLCLALGVPCGDDEGMKTDPLIDRLRAMSQHGDVLLDISQDIPIDEAVTHMVFLIDDAVSQPLIEAVNAELRLLAGAGVAPDSLLFLPEEKLFLVGRKKLRAGKAIRLLNQLAGTPLRALAALFTMLTEISPLEKSISLTLYTGEAAAVAYTLATQAGIRSCMANDTGAYALLDSHRGLSRTSGVLLFLLSGRVVARCKVDLVACKEGHVFVFADRLYVAETSAASSVRDLVHKIACAWKEKPVCPVCGSDVLLKLVAGEMLPYEDTFKYDTLKQVQSPNCHYLWLISNSHAGVVDAQEVASMLLQASPTLEERLRARKADIDLVRPEDVPMQISNIESLRSFAHHNPGHAFII
ncbi:MAG: hypothetical protein RMK15_04540 [Chloroflexota bacterium]|nr:hypothetical protein [Chloroflexota bacterium]